MKTNMVLWRENVEPDFDLKRYGDLICQTAHMREGEEFRHYTSYFNNVDENSYAVVQSNLEGIMAQVDHMPLSIQLAVMKLEVQPFYERLCDNILQELNILTTEPYKVTLWSQGYLGNSVDNHPEHHHYQSKYRTILSWVHFVEPAEEDCFEFITGNGTITPSQRKNDFIVFPSWALHRVKPHESTESERRLVIAGNITISAKDDLRPEELNPVVMGDKYKKQRL